MKLRNNIILITIAICLSSCGNYFEKYFSKNYSTEDYKQGLIERAKSVNAYYTQHPELDAIGLIENGFVNLGYSSFEKQEFNEEKQVLEFAKTIGASVVLLQSKFERTKKVYDNNHQYAISPIPILKDSTLSLTNAFPSTNYNFSVDLKSGEVKEKKTTSVAPNLHFQSEYKNGKLVKQQVSTTTAQQVWNIPLDQRNYVAAPNNQGAIVIPFGKQEREVDVYSYVATFWSKTSYPPALGVNVTDLTPEQKQTLELDFGVAVWAVFKNSPASKAGIYRGDLLLSINGHPIQSSFLMGELIRKNVGKEIDLKLVQNGKLLNKKIKLNQRSF